MDEKTCRKIVKERSGGFCEAAIPLVCTGKAQTMHHRRKAGQGGPWWPTNILHVCGDGTRGCHGWIEANATRANERGLWLFNTQSPLREPVSMTWRGISSWFLLLPHGGVQWPGRGPLAEPAGI